VKVLVDSTVWSLSLRRSKTVTGPHVTAFHELIREGRAVMIGPIRQEVLSGIRRESQFQMLAEKLRAWPDLPIETSDYERAAEHSNSCRAKGIQGAHIDFLICAVAEKHQLAILTTDQDFAQCAPLLPVKLYLEP